MAGVLAKKKTTGGGALPGVLTRVSPGVYKDAKGNTVRSAQGNTAKSTAKTTTKKPTTKTPAQTMPGVNEPNPAPYENYAGPDPKYDPGMTNPAQQQQSSYGNINQQLIDSAATMIPGVMNNWNQPVDWNSLPAAPTADAETRRRIEDQVYNSFMSRQEGEFAKARESFEQSMANRGIPVGSQLYNDQLKQLQQAQTDAKQQALTQAVQMGGTEMERQFNMGTTAHNNALSEMLTKRNLSFDEFSKLRSQIDMTDPRAANLFEQNKELKQMDAYYNALNTQQAGQIQSNLAKQQYGYDIGKINATAAAQKSLGGGGGGGRSGGSGTAAVDPNAVGPDGLTQAQREKMWEWQNNPYFQNLANQAKGTSSPSLVSQVGSAFTKPILDQAGKWVTDKVGGVISGLWPS